MENGKQMFLINPTRIQLKTNGIYYPSTLNFLVKVIFYPEGQAFVIC
jgi:hypothetical protein